MTNTPPAEEQQPDAGSAQPPPPPRYAPPVAQPPAAQPAVPQAPLSQPVAPPQAPVYPPPPEVATGQDYGQTYATPQPPGQQYPAPQQPGQTYPGQQQPQHQYAGQPYPGQPHPGQQPPAQPYFGQQYSGQQYAGQQYPGQQYPAGGFGRPGPGGYFDGAAHPADLTRPLYGANIGQAFLRFFKNYVNFSGRASRSEFWWMALITWVASIVVGFLGGMIGSITSSSMGMYASSGGIESFFGAFFLVFFLGTILPWISIGWRRLHDANLAGPLYLLNLVPYVGGLVVFIFTLLPPKPEGRRFDPIPVTYQ